MYRPSPLQRTRTRLDKRKHREIRNVRSSVPAVSRTSSTINRQTACPVDVYGRCYTRATRHHVAAPFRGDGVAVAAGRGGENCEEACLACSNKRDTPPDKPVASELSKEY